MRRIVASAIVIALLIIGATTALAGSAKQRLDNDLISFTEDGTSGTNGPGGGGISGQACVSAQSGQPASFAGNALLDCDSVGPHNETTIAVNPTDAANIVAASHTYLYNLDKQSAISLLRIFTEAYVSKDGGQSWTNVHPPHGSYRFLTDPALAFNAEGDRLYWSNIASHDSVAGAFSDVSVIVERSDDGGINWTDPVTVAKGNGTISNGGTNVLFNDKAWIAVDRGTSTRRGNVYVTWARQQYRKDVQTESPIYFVRSRDKGVTWTAGTEISGESELCSGQGASGPVTRCDQNDAGFSSPIVAPDGTIYVSFLNHQAQGDSLRDQVLLVSSTDGGDHWSAPRQVVGLIHDGAGDYPTNWRGDSTLTGCQFRIFAAGNLVMSTATANPGQMYYVYAENLDPGATARTNIMVTSSIDGGNTWSTPALVKSSRYDQIFPWAAVGQDGNVRVGYVDRARTAPRGQTCVYGYSLATASDPAATSFVTKRLDTGTSIASDARWFTNFSVTGNYQTRFIGDYTNIAMSPDGSVWASWTDMRDTVNVFGRTGHTEHAVAAKG
ncbi:MAG TPA: sialidase family protein [Candidatus Limnocylindria bacterium]|nr:sialidase family protein [Candidatus Limnocylindria bacterium]